MPRPLLSRPIRSPATILASTLAILTGILPSTLPALESGPTEPSLPATRVQAVTAGDRGPVIELIPRSGPRWLAGVPAGPAREAAAGAAPASRPPDPVPARNGWVLQHQSDAVFVDLSMADATHGFAAAELGRVYKTADGATWQPVLNLGFPRYWYGVHAMSPDTVFITGFQNQTGEGIARWSSDGGATWTADLVIDPGGWLTINQFADRSHGVTTRIGGGITFNTVNGGANPGDWTQVLADPGQGWFAGNFTFRPDLQVYLTGISFCESTDGGASYSCRPSIDPVFDGGVSFPDTQHGWTGGGQISAPVQGWVHRTTDGGQTWSGRILNPPYPIRSLLFFNESLGFAVGGNYFAASGGIWSTTDGGTTWELDIDTGCEMKGIDWARVSPDSVDVWCAGSRSGLGRIYRTRIHLPAGTTAIGEEEPAAPGAAVLRATPNPMRESTTIVAGPALGPSCVDIVDVQGRSVRRLEARPGAGGQRSAVWDGRNERGTRVPAGIYYAIPRGGRHADAIPLVKIP